MVQLAKLCRLCLPRKFVAVKQPEVHFFSHIPDFPIWKLCSQPQKSCQQQSEVTELKRKGQKPPTAIQAASAGQNLGFSNTSEKVGSENRF